MLWWMVAGCGGASGPVSNSSEAATPAAVFSADGLALEAVATGLERVTELRATHGVLVTAQQFGVLAVVHGKTGTPWLDLRELPSPYTVVDGGERGLLGFDFDPDYATNGRVVVSWTAGVDGGAVTTIASFVTTPNAVPGSTPLALDTVLFTLQQPWSNHNGGGVRFGPDGALYVGLGDGGRGNDPLGSGQDTKTPLGGILRLDPDLPAPYIPADNPAASAGGGHPALFAWGLRNPWRFAFLPTGELIAGDVGQDRFEEVTLVPKGGNLGWNVREGYACLRGDSCPGDFVEPVFVYDHTEGISITGGVVPTSGPLAGRYVMGDFGSGRLWSMQVTADGAKASDVKTYGPFSVHPSSFARAEDGGILLADYVSGTVFRIGAASAP